MKRWRPFLYGLAASLLASSYLIHTVKAHSEQRQEQRNQEIEERINGMRQECRFQFPHSIIERVKCYRNMMANV